jgi:hypothetical protein
VLCCVVLWCVVVCCVVLCCVVLCCVVLCFVVVCSVVLQLQFFRVLRNCFNEQLCGHVAVIKVQNPFYAFRLIAQECRCDTALPYRSLQVAMVHRLINNILDTVSHIHPFVCQGKHLL